MKHTLGMQVTVGLLAAMVVAGPVFAETTPTMSESLKRKKKPATTSSQQQEALPSQQGLPVPESGAVRAGAPLRPAPGQGSDIAEEAIQDVTPYLDKTVTKIIIEGNNVIPFEDIDKRLFTKPGLPLTEENLNRDMDSIFGMGWFYDLYPSYKEVPEGVEITYHVMENPDFKQLVVSGNTKLSTERIQSIVNLRPGKMVNSREASRKLQYVEDQYKRDGYILARISDVQLKRDGSLVVQINEGIVEDFKVKGNVKTKDKVILREIRLKKGEPFNSTLARRSLNRIQNLGFFEDVNMKLNPGREPNAVEMEIDVVEQNTGTFGIGAGYSDADGFIGMISVGDKNLRGTGDSIMLRWEFGGEDNKNYEVVYKKPWLDKKETSLGITLYDLTNEYADYDRNGWQNL